MDTAEETHLNDYSAVPAELRNRQQWLCWKGVPKQDGTIDKVPSDPETGYGVDKMNAANWLTFDQAVEYDHSIRRLAGIGFMLTEDDPYTVVDLDGCRDAETGAVDTWAQDVLNRLPDTYTEASYSRTGIHAYFRGTWSGKPNAYINGHKVEIYSSKSFITMNGEQRPGTPDSIADAQDALDSLYAEFGQEQETGGKFAEVCDLVSGPPSDIDDDDILHQLENAKNAAKFRALYYDGDTHAYHNGDDSEADSAQAAFILFYVGSDLDRAEQLMRRSALVRDKWDEDRNGRTYLRLTLENAFVWKIKKQGADGFYAAWITVDTAENEFCRKSLGGINDAAEIIEGVETNSAASHNPPVAETAEFGTDLFKTARQIGEETPEKVNWIAQPWIGPGLVTELVGPAKKAGKTTFLTRLVHSVLEGKPFMGELTEKGPVVYLTEQTGNSFRPELDKAGLLDHDDLYLLEWGLVADKRWPEVMEMAAQKAKAVGAKMVVVDTLSRFAGLKGEDENNSGHVNTAMEPLRKAAHQYSLGVVPVRHVRKSGGDVGDRGRGSGAFLENVDIHIDLGMPSGGAQNPNARRIETLSRFDEVPDELIIELTAQGYKARGTNGAVKQKAAIDQVRDALPVTESEAISHQQIEDQVEGGRTTVQEALKTLDKAGDLGVTGKGAKGDPKRYYLPPFGFEDHTQPDETAEEPQQNADLF